MHHDLMLTSILIYLGIIILSGIILYKWFDKSLHTKVIWFAVLWSLGARLFFDILNSLFENPLTGIINYAIIILTYDKGGFMIVDTLGNTLRMIMVFLFVGGLGMLGLFIHFKFYQDLGVLILMIGIAVAEVVLGVIILSMVV